MGGGGLPAVLHTNSLVLQKCIIRPLEEKVFGGEGFGGGGAAK